MTGVGMHRVFPRDGWSHRRCERGAALLISLIVLLVMTILGVTSAQNTALQERMAGNTRDREIAFQAAEAALRDGEAWLEGRAIPPQSGDAVYVYDQADPSNDPVWEQVDWSDESVLATLSITGTSDEARYIIERMDALQSTPPPGTPGPQKIKHIYRVTAMGIGVSPDARVMLQTTYKYGGQ